MGRVEAVTQAPPRPPARSARWVHTLEVAAAGYPVPACLSAGPLLETALLNNSARQGEDRERHSARAAPLCMLRGVSNVVPKVLGQQESARGRQGSRPLL